jgi:serine/threonine protein kinase
MPVPYTKRTIKELKIILRERGYSGYSSLNKSQLVEMLRHQTPAGSKYERDRIKKPKAPIGKKDCAEGSTRNPKTNRCKKDVIKPYGTIGIPRAFADIAEDCSNEGFSKWVVNEDEDFIGNGVAGSVYYACLGKKDCKYVVKKQSTEAYEKELRETVGYVEENSYKHEMEALIDLQGWKHAPKIYAAWTCGENAYFVMEKLKSCMSEQSPAKLYKKSVVILEKLLLKKWLHTDAHTGNIMCRENGDIVLIDYGRARKFKNMNDTEFMKDHPWFKRNGAMPISEMYQGQNDALRNSFSMWGDL